VFIGYIFNDHVDKTMTKNAKFLARITALDFAEKKIFLCPASHIVSLTPYKEASLLGRVLEESFTSESLFGGSFRVTGSTCSGFLHKSHLEGDIASVKRVKVKELNYFEHYPVFTAIPKEIETIHSFNDISVGSLYEGTITSFTKTPL